MNVSWRPRVLVRLLTLGITVIIGALGADPALFASVSTECGGGDVEDVAPPSLATGAHTVTIEFRDAASNLVTPVRVGVFDGTTPIAPPPPDAYLFQGLGRRSYFYSDGVLELGLDRGTYTVYASKGPQYLPIEFDMDVHGDTLITASLELWYDLQQYGWYAGETHTHMTHGPRIYTVDAEQMMMVIEAEDLHFANVMDPESLFTGGAHPLSRPDRVLYFGEEYRNPHFSHLSLLGLKTWIDKIGCGDNPLKLCGRALDADIAMQVHEQDGALVILTHPYPTLDYMDPSEWPGGGVGRGAPLDLVGGHVDAYDILCYSHLPPPAGVEEYTHALNAGFHLPVCAGTDSALPTSATRPPGGYRVFSRVGPPGTPFSVSAWLEGIRSGQTFVTNYPLFLYFDIQGKGIGGTVQTVQSQVNGAVLVRCAASLSRVEIIADGDVVDTLYPSGDARDIFGTFTVPTTSVRWVVARAVGDNVPWHAIDAGGLFAQTSPIYIERLGRNPATGHPKMREAANYFLDRLSQLFYMYDQLGVFPGDSRAAFDSTMAHAVDYYQRLVPDPPEAFALTDPMYWSSAHGAYLAWTDTPTFRWEEAADPDPDDVVTYTLAYGTDSTLASAVVVPALTGTAYTVPADRALSDQKTYYWRVMASDRFGLSTASTPDRSCFVVDVTATGLDPAAGPPRLELGRGVPNPFNPAVRFRYAVPSGGETCSIDVFDAHGRRVRSLYAGRRTAGVYAAVWDGRDDGGRPAASGVYFVRLRTAAGRSISQKVVLLK